MHHGDVRDSIENPRVSRIRGTNLEFAPPYVDKVGMPDIVPQTFAGYNAQRPKRLFSKPHLNLVGAEHRCSLRPEDFLTFVAGQG
jgi:hypothetical protein